MVRLHCRRSRIALSSGRLRNGLACVLASMSVVACAQSAPSGRWDCETDVGPAQLEFRSSKQLVFAGTERVYRIVGNAIQVIEDGLPVNYAFRLAGDRLDITTPDGDPIACRKAGTSAAAPPDRGPADSGKRGAERQFNHLLSGALCAWAGATGNNGSTSRTTTVRFDGRGQFAVSVDSSFGGDNGLGYGGGESGSGRYEVTAPQVGAPIRIRWSTGEDDVAYVSHVVSGRVAEIKYGSTLFAAGLCGQ
jgi:hypothetical protein